MTKKKVFKSLDFYRLTLSHEAVTLAIAAKSPIMGKCLVLRGDGKWDVFVTQATADTLKQMAETKENLSDTVVRLLTKKDATNV
jgi:hypothetical protein